MNIKISIRQIGSRKKGITEKDFFLEDKPRTVGELITYAVHTCVNEYNKRVENGENITSPLSAGDIDAFGEIGKIAFGINYGGKKADMKKAVEDAVMLVQKYNVTPEEAAKDMGAPLELVLEELNKVMV